MSGPSSPRAGAEAALPDDCREQTLGVAFFDLSRLARWTSSEQDELAARFFQGFYGLAEEHIGPAGGRIVKFMGDAGLAVFPTDAAEGVIFALCDFARAARELGGQFGLDTYLNVNVHVGPVLAGTFGSPGEARFDVIGKTVNVAARLGRRGVTLSQQAYRCLGEQARKSFEKNAPPVTYRWRP